MNYYIYPTMPDVERLNDIMFFNYVTQDGVNFKPPYIAGTTSYLKDADKPFLINDEINDAVNNLEIPQADRDFIANLLLSKKTFEEAVQAGWIVLPPPLVLE